MKTLEEFTDIANTNLDELVNSAKQEIREAKDEGTKSEAMIYKVCLEFTKKYITELYIKVDNNNE